MPAPILTEDQVEEAILAVQRQQEESLQCMALLREQHERWQNSVEQLLAQIRPEYTEVVADLKGEKSKAPTQSTPLEKSLETKPQVTRERPEISQDAMLAIDSTMMEAFQFQEKGPLKRVIGEILSDAAAKKMSTAELSGWELYRHQVKKMVDSKWFEWTAGAIILLNMITIGLETEVSLRSAEGVMIFTNLERVFLAIYTLELVVRFIAGGRASIRDPWWLLDFILVAVGVVALVIAPTLGSIAQQADASKAGIGLFLCAHRLGGLHRFDELGHCGAGGKCFGKCGAGERIGKAPAEEQGERRVARDGRNLQSPRQGPQWSYLAGRD